MCHRRQATKLQEQDPEDSDEEWTPRQQGEGQEEPELPSSLGPALGQAASQQLTREQGLLVQQTSKMQNNVLYSKGLFV